jgi:hypothetical protein
MKRLAAKLSDRQFEKCPILNRRSYPGLRYIPRMTRTVTLLSAYVAQRGLYARVAKQLGMDPSYVSRVANGKRESKKISLAIDAELRKMHASGRKIPQLASKRTA